MKKYLLVLITLLTLTACAEETKEVTATPEKETKKAEQTQEELNVEVKASSEPITYEQLENDEVIRHTRVTIKGKISVVNVQGVNGEFIVLSDDDRPVQYTIKNLTLVKVENNQEVTIYGTYGGKDSSGRPEITATIIE